MSRWHNLSPEKKKQQLQKTYEWRKNNPEKARESTKKSERKRKLKKYGLTPETYEKLFASQGYACGICGSYETGIRDWHVDHDHKTGQTRGILCHHCNLMLGNARDDEIILAMGIQYLRKYS